MRATANRLVIPPAPWPHPPPVPEPALAVEPALGAVPALAPEPALGALPALAPEPALVPEATTAWKVAVTDSASVTESWQALPVPLQAPPQPTNVEFGSAVAVRTTSCPAGTLEMQATVEAEVQVLSVPLTAPVPLPAIMTVSGEVLGATAVGQASASRLASSEPSPTAWL